MWPSQVVKDIGLPINNSRVLHYETSHATLFPIGFKSNAICTTNFITIEVVNYN